MKIFYSYTKQKNTRKLVFLKKVFNYALTNPLSVILNLVQNPYDVDTEKIDTGSSPA